jgi:hypothetical protein
VPTRPALVESIARCVWPRRRPGKRGRSFTSGLQAVEMAGAIPHSFLCPIACDVMDRPVVASDGHSYELEAITRWLQSHTTSPLTNAPLHTTVLIPNVALRSAIEEWRAVQPLAIDPERLSLSEELIGEGSFGRVVAGVLATHGREQRVAVKTLPALTQREARAQFENELRAHLTAQQVSECAHVHADICAGFLQGVRFSCVADVRACYRVRTECAVCLARARRVTGSAS